MARLSENVQTNLNLIKSIFRARVDRVINGFRSNRYSDYNLFPFNNCSLLGDVRECTILSSC